MKRTALKFDQVHNERLRGLCLEFELTPHVCNKTDISSKLQHVYGPHLKFDQKQTKYLPLIVCVNVDKIETRKLTDTGKVVVIIILCVLSGDK